MTVVVSFVKTRYMQSINNLAIGEARIRENITIPGTTTATLAADEIAVIGNGETSMVAAAFGTTPDAATTTATAASSAGVPIPAGTTLALSPAVGSKINVKAVT